LYSTTTVNTEPIIGPPITSTDDKQYPEKIRKIVTDISNLTLIEVSELNELLKVYKICHCFEKNVQISKLDYFQFYIICKIIAENFEYF